MLRDGISDMKAVASIAPQSLTASATGTGVDVKGYQEVTALFQAGAFSGAGPGVTVGLEESDSSGSGYTTVATADMRYDTLTLLTGGTVRVGYLGTKRYVRPVATVASDSTVPLSALVLLECPQYAPAANT